MPQCGHRRPTWSRDEVEPGVFVRDSVFICVVEADLKGWDVFNTSSWKQQHLEM